MAHVRQQCRDAIVTALRGTVTAGGNVIVRKVYDSARTSLPALAVNEDNEQRKPITMPAPRRMEVTSDFDVTIYAEDNADCEATLDDIAVEVETALAMPTVTGPWKELTQIAGGVDVQAAQVLRGRRLLRYRAVYVIREDQPEVPL